MSSPTTLLTAHKGVDLHAATAVHVMQERLDGGDSPNETWHAAATSVLSEPNKKFRLDSLRGTLASSELLFSVSSYICMVSLYLGFLTWLNAIS